MNPQQRAFLAAFRETDNVRLACEVASHNHPRRPLRHRGFSPWQQV